MMSEKDLSTRLIHTGDGQNYKKFAAYQSVPESLPLYLTSVFSFDDVPSVDAIYEHEAEGYIYTRMRHPNTDAVGEILAAADGGDEGLVFSSGMAAITTSVLSVVSSGDHILSSPILYGGVQDYFTNELKRFGVEVTFVDFVNENIEAYIRPNTKLLYTESICNPLLQVPDMSAISVIAKKHGLLFYVDNTFGTSVVVKPLELGADLVLYSATKYLGGHSDIVGGAAVGRSSLIEKIRRNLVLYGCILGAADSWLLARSLRTLDLRVRKHSENAGKVAVFLEKHPKIEKVYYPGLPSSPDHERAAAQFTKGLFGGMLSVNLKGAEKEASAVIRSLPTIKYVPSLAGTATTVSYAAKTSHRFYKKEELEKLGITYGQLRLSIGLENADDIIEELSAALESI
ncbi:MAG: aminotransferase class I/II-fold pyridoxal phosphate-dependent enzyme [Clostridiales bacterium]|nr:aminotransferase class I/II-fold pyridoxal phosphate-dependent enzyme [Clostridiales bacterium]